MPRTVGRAKFATQNTRLNRLLTERPLPLVCVHRGTAGGTVAENTAAAVRLAVLHGADIVEIDLARSTDGDIFVFHTGYEPMAFGIDDRLDTLSTRQIEALQYRWLDETGRTPVERLTTVVESNPDTVLNIDRSWWYWPQILDDLAALRATDRFLMKSNVDDSVAAMAAHPEKFPYLAMADTVEQVERVIATPGLNLVGFELHADHPSHPFCDPGYLRALRDQGLLTWVTALTLSHRRPQYAGYDDEVSILGNPDDGWGKLVGLDIDVIHTDWPTLLLRYLAARGLR